MKLDDDEIKFWELVYLATIARGSGSTQAKLYADDAIKARRDAQKD